MLRDPIRTVLVPVDFGPASGQAVALGGFLASAVDATLRVLHAEAFDVPPYFTLPQIARYEAELEAARAGALDYLRQFVASHTEWTAECAVVEERPAEAIAAAASRADLVIMGTHGRRGPGRWWLGSVAERVVQASDAPVLVLHEGVAIDALAEVWSRVAVVGLGHGVTAPTLAWTRALVGRFQGDVTSVGTLDACRPDMLSDASLIVVELPAPARAAASAAQDAGAVLRACPRPVLFVRAS